VSLLLNELNSSSLTSQNLKRSLTSTLIFTRP
jgi:hypothetical protein